MSDPLIWLFAAFALSSAYWLYCAAASARAAPSARSFFLADRDLPPWVFVLAGTGVSFPAWIVLGHADLVARNGLAFAETALCAVTVPLAGVLFLKRQWMLGKRYGYVTPAEMLGDYYGGEAIRLGTVAVALMFAIPFAGLQLGAAAHLVVALTGLAIDPVLVLWVLTGVVFAYTCIGGLRAAAFAGASQTLLLGAGAIMVGVLAVRGVGGIGAFGAALLGSAAAPGAATAPPLLDIPGVMQFVRGLGVEAPAGSPWTATMIGSYCLALMGLQLAPSFCMLAFATRSPKGFAAQQTWGAAGAMGGVLVLFVAASGLGARVGSAGAPAASDAGVVAAAIGHLAGIAPWFVGILGVAAFAGAQVFAALNLSAASTMVVRDVYRRYVVPDLDIVGQRRAGRIAMGLITMIALLLATFAPRAEIALGSLALGFGVQLLPALAGLCWLRRITREGIAVGFVAGLSAVILAEPPGGAIATFFGVHLPWGRWPWTLHSAAWGLAANVAGCLVVSLISRKREDAVRQNAFHVFLATASGGRARASRSALAWALTLAWVFFAIGPGAIYGNTAFGEATASGASPAASMPSLWIWQVLWWVLGVLLIWFLANRLALSTRPQAAVTPLPRSQRPRSDVAALAPHQLQSAIWIAIGIVALAVLANWLFT